MQVRSDKEKWRFVIVVTGMSLAASLSLTWLLSPVGLEPVALVPASVVPLIIAPFASFWAAHAMLRIHRLNQRLEHLVRHDQMTGLMTRGAFFERFDGAAPPGPGALLVLDIDRFKRVNDTHGHHVGDHVICEVARVLKALIGPQGMVARLGGEEFVAFLPGVDPQGATASAEDLRAAIEATRLPLTAEAIRCTISVGVGHYDGASSLDAALRRADRALYQAKHLGRNRVCSPD